MKKKNLPSDVFYKTVNIKESRRFRRAEVAEDDAVNTESDSEDE